jgi:hypothetical protein
MVSGEDSVRRAVLADDLDVKWVIDVITEAAAKAVEIG